MPIEVAPLAATDAATALTVIEADEATRGASVVDEAELERLRRYAETGQRTDGWLPLVAHVGEEAVGYGGLRIEGDTASGDAAATHDAADPAVVLESLLVALAGEARTTGAARVQVWVRQVGDAEYDAADAAGFAIDRRLGILGRDLSSPPDTTPPADGWHIRPSQRPADDDAIVAVLAAAYEGTDEAGWDLGQLHERQAYDWFRAEDLLVAEGPDGRIGGLHWLKRRSRIQGEVYNLAIAPHAQGNGLGAALLTAGLRHLHDVGCTEVILWVDRANDRAVRLYERSGFTTRWDDVAFGRDLG